MNTIERPDKITMHFKGDCDVAVMTSIAPLVEACVRDGIEVELLFNSVDFESIEDSAVA